MTPKDFYGAYHNAVIEMLEGLARQYEIACRIAKNDAVRYVVLKLNAFVFSEFAVQVGLANGQFELFYQNADSQRHYAAVDDLDSLYAQLEALMPDVRAVYERQWTEQQRWMDEIGDAPDR
jgi:hypothetical protein